MIELHFICWMLSISINKIVFSYCWEVLLEMEGGSASLQAVLCFRKIKIRLLPKQDIYAVSVSLGVLSHGCLQAELGLCNSSLAVSLP